MNKRLWIGIGVLLVLGWLGYRQFVSTSRTVGSLVPPGALMMIASDHLQDTISAKALRTEMALRQIPVFDEARQRLDRFLYATADTATVQKFVSGRNIRYSLHSISKTTLDYIFYIPISDADQSFINNLLTPDPRQYRVLNHTFSGEKILDLVSRNNDPIGSFILTENYLIASASGILVENVAKRMHQSIKLTQPEPDFQVNSDLLASVTVRPEVFQSLFSNIGSLVKLFLPEELNLQFRRSASPSHLIAYAVDQIGGRKDVAALFADQTPRRIQHAELIPQTTATLYHIGISNPRRFGQSLSQLLGSASSDFLRDRFDQIKPMTKPLYQSLGNEILLCRLESSTGATRQVLVLTAQNGKQLADSYQQIAYQAGAKVTIPKNYLGHKLLQLNVAELPASLFSSLFSGFSQSWITQHGTSLIVATSEETLQDYLLQLQRGTVWSTDQRQAELLRTTLRPANFTAFVRLNRAHTTVPSTWPLAWQNLLDQVDPSTGTTALANLENMAYQASYGKENIQSTVVLGRTTLRTSQALLNKVLLRKRFKLTAPLLSAPIVTGNLAENVAQFYAQGTNGQFSLITSDGEKNTPNSISVPIMSNTIATDFLNNGRLQYLFMTDQTLYIADPIYTTKTAARLLAIPLPKGINPTYLARPRGSQQRNLVALVAHVDGHIYALDRQRQTFIQIMAAPQKGPLQLPFQVIPTPRGMEVLAIQANGVLNHWNENGKQYPHFPAQIERQREEDPEIRFEGPALQSIGQSTIQTITDEGLLLTLNNTGLIARRTQLYRPVRRAKFRLFPDEDMTNWLLLRTSDTEISVLDQQGQRRFDVRALQSGRNNIRYHRLGSGVEVISVKSGGFTTLYNLNGGIIGDHPIPSEYPITLQFNERSNELYILGNAKQTVQLFSIRLR